jgi:predicted ferric reductase
MSTIWQSITWDIARAGGFTAYILLALAVIVGLALSTQIQSPSRWPRLLNSELHNFLTLLSTIFLGVHILATWIDPFTKFSWNEILIPLTSHYRPEWMAFGIVALYLGIAIGISTWIRPLIGYKVWRKLHILTLVVFTLATIHGLGTGSDTQTLWALGIYLVSTAVVGLLLCRRLYLARRKSKVARSGAHGGTRTGANSVPTIHENAIRKAPEVRFHEQKQQEVVRSR